MRFNLFKNHPENPSDNTPKKADEESPKSRLANFVTTASIFIAAPLVALVLTAFVFQSYEVDGPSMEATLQDGDRLIVLKAAKAWARLSGNKYVPARGDIVIFSKHGVLETSDHRQKQLIKRVVALPGDRVQVKDGVLTVYNSAHPDGFKPDEQPSSDYVIHSTSGNDVDQRIYENEVFVMGDNRGNSTDSRVIGSVSVDDIVGKLSLRIYPLNKIHKF